MREPKCNTCGSNAYKERGITYLYRGIRDN